ncbi:AGZA family xanthine/uracil permease-like MFS transporter [Salsuginibacillus halophilus]|uniref:AGZA family xanthine/uracil permease-like MFS transporter n=1 Tax=Salsuginibacillus halophilus TaxID=517424 RepID=A0A2P8HDU0_9BACI|nr:AGZA family xanthine/uracil permease-like MFS transporter [Salsuginibacillus halophilus]
MKEWFKLEERKTNVKTETLAGFTTFLTMVYIVVVNPAILSSAGVPFDQVFMATIISAVIGTLLMAFWANYPIAIAPGMGMNAYFASVVATEGLSYEVIFGTVVIAGLIFFVLTLTRVREQLVQAIPDALKYGITGGIGLFIAFLGLQMSGLVVPDEETFVTLGDLQAPMVVLTLLGLFVTLLLMARGVKGALFLGMLVTAGVGYAFGMLSFTGVVSAPPAFTLMAADVAGVFTHGLYMVVLAFLLVTIFDTTGTTIGVAEQAGLMKEGKLDKAKPALGADAAATTVGGMLGTSPTTAYIESSAGVASGGRSGLTGLVAAVLLLLTVFFSPLVSAIADLPAITAPVLIIVGSLMMEGLSRIDWKTFDEAFPAFLIILMMPLTSSIATGIAAGFIAYPAMKLVSGKGKQVPVILYVLALIFAVQMVFFPAH